MPETEQQHQTQARKESEAIRAGEATITSSIQIIARNLINFVSRQHSQLLTSQLNEKSLRRLAADWVSSLKTRLVYDKIRLDDENGKERLWLNMTGQSRVSPRQSELENKTIAVISEDK